MTPRAMFVRIRGCSARRQPGLRSGHPFGTKMRKAPLIARGLIERLGYSDPNAGGAEAQGIGWNLKGATRVSPASTGWQGGGRSGRVAGPAAGGSATMRMS